MSTVIEAPARPRAVTQEASRLKARTPNYEDAKLVRYGWSAGLDIGLSQRTGSRFCGNFPDEKIPRRTLIAFTAALTLAPWEIPAVVGSRMEDLDARDVLTEYEQACIAAEDEGYEHQKSQVLTRQPRTVAYDIARDYDHYGLCLFEHLKGDNWEELQGYYDLILPEDAYAPDGLLAPVERMSVLGFKVRGTFLDQVRDYVIKRSPANLARAGLDAGQFERAEGVLREMRGACDRAWRHMTKVIAESNLEIRRRNSGGVGKNWYDERDADFLVETNIRPLERSDEAPGEQAGALVKGFREVVRELRSERVGTPEPHVSPEVQRLAAENASMRAEVDALKEVLRGQALADAQSGAPMTAAEFFENADTLGDGLGAADAATDTAAGTTRREKPDMVIERVADDEAES
jgi:hypothetical protein